MRNFPGGPLAKISPLNAEGCKFHMPLRQKQNKTQNIKQKQYCIKFNRLKVVHIKKNILKKLLNELE